MTLSYRNALAKLRRLKGNMIVNLKAAVEINLKSNLDPFVKMQRDAVFASIISDLKEIERRDNRNTRLQLRAPARKKQATRFRFTRKVAGNAASSKVPRVAAD